MMAIPQKEYKNQKEYWDYQRKVQYNKEQIFAMADRFEGRVYNDFGMVHIDDMKNHLWNRIEPSEYEDPPKDWIPKDEKYRIEGEDVSTGRKVVLRANLKKLDSK